MRTVSGVVVALALIVSTTQASAINCEARAGKGSGWSWRQIDGKRCWFKGSARTNKKLLRWSRPAKAREATPPSPDVGETTGVRWPETPAPLLPVDWPEAPMMFEDRWCMPCQRGQQ